MFIVGALRVLNLILVGCLALPQASSSAAQAKTDETKGPKSLSDCEKEPAPAGSRWQFYSGAGCSLLIGVKPVDCSGSMVCSNDDTDWAKQNAWGLQKAGENEFLTAMQEPSLVEDSQARGGAEEYRLTWLRSFHHPVIVRLVINADGGVMITKMTSGKGGYAAGKLTLNNEKRLTTQSAINHREAFDNLRFFSTYTNHYDKSEVISDGALWVLEGVKNGHYHKVLRHAPPCDDEIRKFSLNLMIYTAHLKLLYDEVY